MMQKKTYMSSMSIEFIVNIKRSVCHTTDAFSAKKKDIKQIHNKI